MAKTLLATAREGSQQKNPGENTEESTPLRSIDTGLSAEAVPPAEENKQEKTPTELFSPRLKPFSLFISDQANNRPVAE